MLEGGDGTAGVRKGGLEMGQDLSRRRPARANRRPSGRRAASEQGRADFALRLMKASPDALPSPFAEIAGDGAPGRDQTAGDGEHEEGPQGLGGQAESSDFVRVPDAEGSSAPGARIAVAAKDAAGAHGLSLGISFIIAAEHTMPIQGAGPLAMGTERLLEPLGNPVPFLVALEKPTHLAHWSRASTKILILQGKGKGAG
jgi:hypothetical protein